MIVGIAGVGLLGGSIGYILKKKKWADKVIGVGRNEERLKKAVKMGAVDRYVVGYNEELREIDLLILCVPVGLIAETVKNALPYLKGNVIITDVGSTKGNITREIEEILPEGCCFVGGHPMAGSEKTGVEALDPYLFENAVYIITKTNKTNSLAVEKVKEMARVLDANVIEMDADKHDEAVAAISHTPHLVAAALVASADNIDKDNGFVLGLAAGGFRDTTRIASGSPDMWRDICLTNKEKIIETLEEFEESVRVFKESIKTGDGEDIYRLFDSAKKVRDRLPNKKKGILSPMFEIVVFVPDKPGVIGKIANILGENNINIKDIEVLNVRENEGGSIRIGLDVKERDKNVVEILKQNGYEFKIVEG